MNIILAASAAEVFTYIGYVILAILVLMVMIVVHESGHYLAGKLFGFKIDEFSIGFGPALFKRTNKKTGELFAIRCIPLGGYCAFHGEDEEGEDEKSKKQKAEVSDMTEAQVFDDDSVGLKPKYGILAPETQTPSGKRGILAPPLDKKDKCFNDMPAWQRLIVLFSGAFFNFLSAILIITIYFCAYGQILPEIVQINTPDSYTQCFEEGDVILAVNGKQVNIMLQEDVNNTFANLGESAEFKVLRDGKVVKFTAEKTDYVYSYEVTDENGEPTGKIKTEEKHGFGISYGLTRQKLTFFRAFGRSFSFCFFIVFKILASLGALITGKIGLESAGGTITVVKTIAEVSALGFDSFLYVVAIISANLAVMNLLPLPALDGSRMVFTLIEMIFRKPVPRKIEAVIHAVGLILLIVLVVFLDIFHLVSG